MVAFANLMAKLRKTHAKYVLIFINKIACLWSHSNATASNHNAVHIKSQKITETWPPSSLASE
jgi:hypothetical protein